MKRAAPLRRVPTQARSRERMERMLDAGAEQIAEVGYEAATMQAIAERAETSIGSLYQFFPNKRVLFDAIARREEERERAMLDALFTPEFLSRPWTEVLDVSLQASYASVCASPSARAVWVQGLLTPALLDAANRYNRELARRLVQFLASAFPGIPPARRELVAMTVVETVSATMLRAIRDGEDAAEGVLEETRVMLRRYLEGYVEVPAAPRAKARKKAR
jgi:AcrR family transcriptional regulator